MNINYNNRVFKPVSNVDHGEVSPETIFHYRQEGHILFSEYKGGKIVFGQLIGTVNEVGIIDMRYQQINSNGELMTGKCKSTPKILADGRIRLYEEWQWTSGDCSKGQSIIEEIPKK